MHLLSVFVLLAHELSLLSLLLLVEYNGVLDLLPFDLALLFLLDDFLTVFSLSLLFHLLLLYFILDPSLILLL